MTTELRLEDLQIASPCGVSWDDMRGDARVRHCDHCTLNVYNISEMSREEAMSLIRAHEGDRVCVRMLRREDGTVITADCPVGLARVRQRLRRMAAGVAALFGLTGLAAAVEVHARDQGIDSARYTTPFAWIAEHVFGKAAPAPQQCVLGAIMVPINTTPLTVEGDQPPLTSSN